MSMPVLLMSAALAMPDPLDAAGLTEADVAEPMTGTVVANPTPLALTPERVERIRDYQSQRMYVRDETELRGGAAAVAMSQPVGAHMTTPSVVLVDPMFTVQTWGVYRGDDRIGPSEFLRETGETFRADDLDRRVERDRRKARRWMLVAGVGAASLAAGVVQYDRATTLPEELLAHQLTFGGLGVGMTGLMAASFPASRATRLERYPSAAMNRDDAEKMVERHNKALQQRLGLTEEDVLLIDLADSL